MTALALATRRKTDIPNAHVTIVPTAGDIARAQSFRTKFMGLTHRDTQVCFTYNCHGLTFAARRTEINDAAVVRNILNEDSYVPISTMRDLLPGDIIVYIDDEGDIHHSGVVVRNDPLVEPCVPWILSKWGGAHEIIHPFNYLEYEYVRVEFYRVVG